MRKADRIIVLEGGRIIEEGSHDALIDSEGHYAELYDRYFRHQSPDYVPAPPPPLRTPDWTLPLAAPTWYSSPNPA